VHRPAILRTVVTVLVNGRCEYDLDSAHPRFKFLSHVGASFPEKAHSLALQRVDLVKTRKLLYSEIGDWRRM